MPTSKIEKVSKVEKVSKAVVPTKPVKKAEAASVEVLDIKGKATGKMSLPEELFNAKINDVLMAQAVRVYLANQRMGSAWTQSRGDVSMTSAKWYKQKGTGRARHGAKSAPIFVHGGVAHGPKPHDFSLKLSKKMKKAALASALTVQLRDGVIKVVGGLEKVTPKTKAMVDVLQNIIANSKKRKILLVVPTTEGTVSKAARNIKGVSLVEARNLHTYMVLTNKNILFMENAIAALAKKGEVNG